MFIFPLHELGVQCTEKQCRNALHKRQQRTDSLTHLSTVYPRESSSEVYCSYIYTWPLSAECAVDLEQSTNRECNVCIGYNKALVTIRYPIAATAIIGVMYFSCSIYSEASIKLRLLVPLKQENDNSLMKNPS